MALTMVIAPVKANVCSATSKELLTKNSRSLKKPEKSDKKIKKTSKPIIGKCFVGATATALLGGGTYAFYKLTKMINDAGSEKNLDLSSILTKFTNFFTLDVLPTVKNIVSKILSFKLGKTGDGGKKEEKNADYSWNPILKFLLWPFIE